MTAVVMPARRWGDESAAEAPAPTVLVSSRDGAPVPAVPAVARLAAAAKLAGWAVRQTYALADVPAAGRRAAHQFASVAVRIQRGDVAGFAVWGSTDGGAWKFEGAVLGMRRLGARAFAAEVKAP